MTFNDFVFWMFAVLAVVPALGVLLSRQIVRMAFWLLASLAGFAGLYLQIGAGFLGFTQVLVYIGGILILILFGIMLTQKVDVPVRERRGWAFVLPGLIAGLVIGGGLLFIALGTPWMTRNPTDVAFAAPTIGERFMSTYVLPFEAVSVFLLAAMVGASYVARSHEERQQGRDDAGKES